MIKKIVEKVVNYVKNNVTKKHIIIISSGLSLMVIGALLWVFVYSKYEIFYKQEKRFREVVEDYFTHHSVYLPKEGLTKTTTLEDLFLEGRIEELYVPKTNKLCDLNSWVKVYNDNGNYVYKTYLKCGRYESKIDHEGPVITLNGDSTIYVHLNQEYEELGIEKVVDDTDGKMDISSVVIDSSKVNTKKIGTYEVIYTATDQLNNISKVIRTVVVAKNLTELVKEETDESNYYKGQEYNNYILFSGMLYRIINVNSDGTVTLISNENLNNLRADYTDYENSNIDLYLNNEYLNIIHDDSYLVDTEVCVGNIGDLTDLSSNCNKTLKRKVALLDISKFQNTFKEGNSYLCSKFNYALSSKVNGEIVTVECSSNNDINSLANEILPSIRPVITLKSNLHIVSGSGTNDDPYKLDDYDYGKQNQKINTRLVGEYINYSGNVYRIMDIDDNNNVKVISTDGIARIVDNALGKDFLTSYVPEDGKFVFNVTEEDNPGYKLNREFIDYINENYIIKKEYSIPLNVSNKSYKEYQNKTVSAKLVLPKTYDLFAGKQSNSNGYMYLYLDETTNENDVFFMVVGDGKIYEETKNFYDLEYCLKVVMTLNGNLTIKSGKGTVKDPYYIR